MKEPVPPHLVFSASLTLCLFLFSSANAGSNVIDQISVSCGSTATSTSLDGRDWLGDPKSSLLSIKGSSTVSSVTGKLWSNIDPVPYRTARIAVSEFSYSFQLRPGQKFIRLHFNPTSYYGDKRFKDLFTVEAGPFILLANFSATITAHALGKDTFAKEFCITLQENQPLNMVFSPAAATAPSQDKFYAFINGIEIISVPSGLSYCHAGDIGVQVVGQRSIIYVDNTTALELVHRQSIKRDFDDVRDMFGTWATIHADKANKKLITWKVSVDMGFSYLVRFHLCELGVKLAENPDKNVILVINHVTVTTGSDILHDREDRGCPWHKNYMVMVKGHSPEGNRDIMISLHSMNGLIMGGRGPFEGFEIFKLSNEANSLASPTSNSWPPSHETPSDNFQSLSSLLGCINSVAAVVITVICLLNCIASKLQQSCEVNFCEEENSVIPGAKLPCRHFSLHEIQSATENFFDGFVIGKGGFGKVYKGFIDNRQQAVAIKRLKSNSSQGKHEFWMEVETLSVLQHVNLVSLVGYCNEQKELILVYEYLPSGTLSDHLYKLSRKRKACSPLSWKQRLQICIGVGRGLDYLHTGHGIIHRDIKTSNILLDENFVPKVSDFGLAKSKSERMLQRKSSTNVKGTFGYLDPDYFRTRIPTTKSDTYSFGVLLLEVLCGRPAVDKWADEDKRSLITWARDNISRGQVNQIVAPNLSGEISPDSLKMFIRVIGRCLHDEPKMRPTMAHVIIYLEYAFEQHENGKPSSRNGITSVVNFFPCTHKAQQDDANTSLPNEIVSIADAKGQQENANSMILNEIASIADGKALQDNINSLQQDDVMLCTNKVQKENLKPLLHNMMTGVTNLLACYNTTCLLTNVEQVITLLKERVSSKVVSVGKRNGRKTIFPRIWPQHALQNTAKQAEKKAMVSISVSVFKLAMRILQYPICHGAGTMALRGSAFSINRIDCTNDNFDYAAGIRVPNLPVFTFSELKTSTREFGCVIGQGGFGKVYKGWFDEKLGAKADCGSLVAVKRLGAHSNQGYQEWLSEVNVLGQLSHPNLVKLLGYCQEDNELLLVYEYLPKGSLDVHLFRGGDDVKPLGWNDRLNILIHTAHALAFLHDENIIYRDLKTSNILLDQSNHAKLSDFGLVNIFGPVDSSTHISSVVKGTYGYAAPEYVATGHLNMKSDVYGFGVVMLEMLTGLRVIDHTKNRLPIQWNMVDWIKPLLPDKRKMKKCMDTRLDGRYPTRSAFRMAQLSRRCLEPDPRKRPCMQYIVQKLESMDFYL